MSDEIKPQASFEKSLKAITNQTRTEFRDDLLRFNRSVAESARPAGQLPLPDVPPKEVVVREIKLAPVLSTFETGTRPPSQSVAGNTTALGPIVLTLSKNGVATDYDINGRER